MSHCFEPIVGAQFLVDVVEVVAKRLRGDLQFPRNHSRIGASSKERKDAPLLAGKGFDGRAVRCVVVNGDDVTRDLQHLVEQILLLMPLADVPRQTNEESPSGALVVENDR